MILTDYMCHEMKGKEDLPLLKSISASMTRLEDYIKTSKERVITATRNNAHNTRIKEKKA